ncbi:Endonuclease 4 [Phycisphaerae bacterium RAS1]|nr:Endonuclease 4 [Phycisphaerae bacterium RAS1]
MASVKKTRRHRFGSHLSVAGGLHLAIAEARRLTFDTVQVFVKNQRQWAAAPLRKDAIDAWHAALPADGFGPVVAHASYLINLASADDALYEKSRRALADELQRCDLLAIPYLVVHPGAAVGAPIPDAIRRVSAAINRIFDATPASRSRLLLETTAGQGSTLGRTFEELAEMIAGVRNAARVGVCIDTCHVFAAGYDIRDANAYAQMIALVERTVGLESIRCWHLNDSRGALGSRVDRHEHIGKGCIGDAGFANVLSDPRFFGLPMILETPKEQDSRGRDWDAVNLKRLISRAK